MTVTSPDASSFAAFGCCFFDMVTLMSYHTCADRKSPDSMLLCKLMDSADATNANALVLNAQSCVCTMAGAFSPADASVTRTW
jgi:hypothetical protein